MNSEAVMTNEPPTDGLDSAVVDLCKALNEFPGIATSESCQGFIDGHRPGEPWAIYFGPDPSPPTPEGYISLEFLTWLCRHVARDRGFEVRMSFNAPPPYLNDPGRCLYFVIEGMNRHPDEFAKFVREARDHVFCLPDPDHETDA